MFFYNYIAVPFLKIAATIGGNFNKKIADRERNVRKSFKNLEKLSSEGKRVWFHAASVGEFEQAKPVIEAIKEDNPEIIIIVSFFSPSAYNTQRSYKYADAIVYMPLDTRKNAREFIELLKPDVAIFVRYEAWFNHLSVLKGRNIPTLLICATLSQKKIWNYPLLKTFRFKTYSLFTKIYTVSEEQTERLKKLKLQTPFKTLTDTRFDRIAKIIDSARREQIIPESYFGIDDFVLVAGSTWEADEDMIIEAFSNLPDNEKGVLKLVLVPHEPTPEHITLLKTKLPDAILLSEIGTNSETENFGAHIIVDSIGKLLKLYAVADAAYIGGGFGIGVHSTTEPAGYGIPLATGHNIHNSPDAPTLEKLGALTVLKNAYDCKNWLLKIIQDDNFREKSGETARKYIYDSLGSTEIIAREIAEYL
ncbi:MAG: glycosyltransferase N-terminal domain-containing protein [Bacteroidota bacterium]